MRILINRYLPLTVDVGSNYTELTLWEEEENSLEALRDAIEFHYFKQEFKEWLSVDHESACISSASENNAMKKFWDLYKTIQTSYLSEFEAFEETYEQAKNDLNFCWQCSRCGCLVFGEFPEVDGNGNVYCDCCDENYMGYCDYCDCKYDYENALYKVDDDKYVCGHCLSDKLRDGTLKLDTSATITTH
jgi:hypothetical protein